MPSEANPSDDIIRGLSPTELDSGFRYSSGPKFLNESTELWPENKVKAPCENDEMKEKKNERWARASQEIKVLWNKYVADQTKKSYRLCDAICKQCRS